jgi:site-specific DNA-methyltransferase (adenine-specific)
MLNSNNYNPDVLSCLANLSSDEIFTPPQMANRLLDLLPEEIWKNKDIKFLDPVCKTGVFLREIAKRLITGLEDSITDKQKRIDHIFKNQLYGISITEITALLSRRSVYCSKTANGKYSVCESFDNEQGNILFNRIKHTWDNGKCKYCGASQENYERGDELETHAYQFIHKEKPEEIFNMKFDVIIGNPPYQLSDGGFGRSASPIYHKFVQQAKKLNPRYLVMIIPSRWFAGGKGLDDFRTEMLNDDRIRKIVDFEDASECFPGVDIAGGICYFLWEKDSTGPCEIINMHNGKEAVSTRKLNEFNTFIRHGKAVPIIRKVLSLNEKSMSEQVSSRKPFGLPTNARPLKKGDLVLKWNNGEGPYEREKIEVGSDLIDKWKVITSKVSYDHAGQPDKNGMRKVLSIVDILPPKYICTETYIIVGSYKNKKQAENMIHYLKTKFVRFLVSQMSFSQDITKDRFYFVPVLDMSEEWTDEKLYKRYNLTKEEIDFIESKIRPME